jgi:hypothetical protein
MTTDAASSGQNVFNNVQPCASISRCMTTNVPPHKTTNREVTPSGYSNSITTTQQQTEVLTPHVFVMLKSTKK